VETTPAFPRIAADNHRLASPFGMVELLDGGEERVESTCRIARPSQGVLRTCEAIPSCLKCSVRD